MKSEYFARLPQRKVGEAWRHSPRLSSSCRPLSSHPSKGGTEHAVFRRGRYAVTKDEAQ